MASSNCTDGVQEPLVQPGEPSKTNRDPSDTRTFMFMVLGALVIAVGVVLLGYWSGVPGDPVICPDACQQCVEQKVKAAELSSGSKDFRNTSQLVDNPVRQYKQTNVLLDAWNLGTTYSFAALAGNTVSAEEVVAGPGQHQGTVLVVIASGSPPIRRSAEQPFLQVERSEQLGGLQSVVPVESINAAAAALERILGRRLFPLRFEARPFNRSSAEQRPPFAVYDVSSGAVTVDEAVLAAAVSYPANLMDSMAAFATSLFSQITSFAAHQASPKLETVANVVSRAATAAVAVGIAYQVPLWFCIACPIVLGMLAPFAFNFGLGAVAQAVCDRYKLPDQDCAELWYGAFAMAMVLSLASAVPIVFICKLPQCGKSK